MSGVAVSIVTSFLLDISDFVADRGITDSALPQKVKWPECGGDCVSSSNAEFKNAWNLIPISDRFLWRCVYAQGDNRHGSMNSAIISVSVLF
jgi:hypothetical protein